jgi:hypothetical protein
MKKYEVTDADCHTLSEQHGLTAKSSAKEIRRVFPNLPEHGAFPEFRTLRLIDGIPGFELAHSYKDSRFN